MTREQFQQKDEEAYKRHERAMKDGASWYCWIYFKILRAEGHGRAEALEQAFRRHPRALWNYKGRICDDIVFTNSNANAAARSRAASATPSVRTADASYGWNGVKNADQTGI